MRLVVTARSIFVATALVLASSVAALAVPACKVYEPPAPTGGGKLGEGECGGVTVISNPEDYSSTSVALLGFDGRVLSRAMLTSGSQTTGLSAAFSGDVVLATSPTPSPHFVLIDRNLGAPVLTWVDAKQGTVSAQLGVGTGFAANPQDYLEISPQKAYVSRYQDNITPGQEPFDGGGDVLIVDPSKPQIVDRIDMHPAFTDEDPSIEPRPGRMVVASGNLYVLCVGLSRSFATNGDSKLVTVDTATDQITNVTTLTGSQGCSGLALSPSGKRIAISCTGPFAGKKDPKIDQSALIVLDRTDMSVVSRLPATTFGSNPLGFSVAFVSEDSVMFPTFGSNESSPHRRATVVRTSIDGQSHEVVLESDQMVDTLNDVRCSSTCGACFATDAERSVIDRFPIENDALRSPTAIKLNDGIGALPRYLGAIGTVSR